MQIRLYKKPNCPNTSSPNHHEHADIDGVDCCGARTTSYCFDDEHEKCLHGGKCMCPCHPAWLKPIAEALGVDKWV